MIFSNLSLPIRRFLGLALVLVIVFVIVLIAQNSSVDVEESREDSLNTTPEGSAFPIEEGPAYSLLPTYSGGSYTYENGIPRYASMDTIIPTRARVDLLDYEVQAGDNLFSIAESFGLRPESILWGNIAILEDNPNFIQPGQILQIMPIDGVLHNYNITESIESIAELYKSSVEAIIEWAGNHIDPYDLDSESPSLVDGMALIVPGGSRLLRDWGPPAITRDNPAVASYYGPGSCGSIGEGAVGNGSFVWPTVDTRLTTDFIPPIHRGIDIAGIVGGPIYAADGGVVVYAGWSNVGFGNLLVIDHGTDWQTAYAHLDTIAVECGTNVSQGAIVAGLGNTGNSSGPHLHFELLSHIYGKVNPLNYLIQ